MDTQTLIETLVSDREGEARDQGPSWLLIAILAAVTTGISFFAFIGLRPDIGYAVETTRFVAKVVVSGTVAITAFLAMRALARPGAAKRRALDWLVLPAGLLVFAVAAELYVIPPNLWAANLIGTNYVMCVIAIVSLGAPLLIMFLWALRRQAPTRPALAGGMAGLAAAAMAAFFYAAQCPNDSPLFVAVWYSLASLILVAAGGVAGHRVLRW
ncbi:NrsF family protein [Aurantimonas marianensis]|uniref:NrsF family protein n=1 Tax=Aurantimonas marianensis TaxID=2920428 RepID=A0A9X2H658_9HYPH|nr:NrsF family protein [Aurantimonas marianensis]MCP3054906.1 NrsF family protein [Aurantimonas marianensis]